MLWGYAAALGAMLLYGTASVLQAFAASRAQGSAMLRHPAYLGGLTGDGVAWLLSLAALAWLPLFVVQTVLAGSLAVTVLLAAPALGIRPSRRDLTMIGVVTLGLVLVSASAGPESHQGPPGWFTPALLIAVAAVLLLGGLLYGRGRSVALATLAGLGFSASALGARAAHLGEAPWRAELANPLTWAVLVSGIAGALLYARSLEKGAIGPATAALWVVEVIVPGIVGVAVLGDAVRPGWALPALAGVACAIAGSLVLARSPAQAEPVRTG